MQPILTRRKVMNQPIPKEEKATNAGWSAYTAQKNWARDEARRLTEERGVKYTASKVIQHLIDQARSKQKGGK